MPIEDTYPGYAEQIRAARSQGFSDEEIQGEFQNLIREQSRSRIPVEQISRGLGNIRQPRSLSDFVFEAVGGPIEAAGAVGSQFVGAPIAGLAGLVRAAIESPRAIRERGVMEGIPTAFERAAPIVESGQEMLSYQPRTEYGRSIADVGMIPERLSEEAAQYWSDKAYELTESPTAAAAVNTAAQFFLDPTNLIFAPAAFRRVKGRPPKSFAEVTKAFREEQGFTEELAATRENIRPEMAERIQAAQKEGFTPEEIGQALAEIEPEQPVSTRITPAIEKTPAGDQFVIPGAEARNIPESGLEARARQTEELTELERASLPDQQTEFLPEQISRAPVESTPAPLSEDALIGRAVDLETERDAPEVSRPAEPPLSDEQIIPSKSVTPERTGPSLEERARIADILRARRAAAETATPAPAIKPRKTSKKKLDEELSLSSLVRREGGIRITDDIPGELRGLTKENRVASTLLRKDRSKGMTAEEMAEIAHAKGFISEPTTNALLAALRDDLAGRKVFSGAKIERAAEANLERQAIEYEADRKIDQLQRTDGPIEFEGKTFEKAERVGGTDLKLTDGETVVLKKADDILKVEQKPVVDDVPFDVPEGNFEAEPGADIVGEPPAGYRGAQGSLIPAEPPGKTTSVKNAVVDQELAAMGQPPASHGARMSFEEARSAAAEQIRKDPTAGQKLVDELEAKPRPATATEDALLLHEQTRLKNERVAAENALIEAQKTGSAEAVTEAKRRVEQATADFARIADVVTKVGTESSLSLGHRRMMMREDYSLAAMERAKQVANDGKPLTDQQRAEVKALHEKINATQKAFDEYVAKAEQQKAEAESRLAHTRMVVDVDKAPAVDPKVKSLADRIVAAMEREAESARARIKEKMGRLSAGLDPTLVADMAVVGAAKLARGALEFSRWSKAMLDDLGQAVEPYLQAVWDASNTKLDEFVAKRAPKQSQAPIKRALKSQDATERRAAILEQIQAKTKEGGDVTILAQGLARTFVEQGIKERNALIDAVHKELVAILPDMTRREAMDAISGYGRFKELAKDQTSTELRDLKGQMQQVAKLEDIEARVPPKKTGVEQRTPSDEERRLIQQVNDAKRRLGVVQTDPARQLQTALGAIKARLRNSIADLEYQIANRQKIVRQRSDTPLDREAKELQARRDELRKQFSEIFGRPQMTDAQRLQAYKSGLARRTTELERRLEKGDFAPRQRTEIQLDAEGKRLQYANAEAKRRWNEALLKDQLANRSTPQKILGGVGEVLNTSRAVLTSLDLSAVLRQGGFIGLGHPIRAARAMPDMFKALRSKQGEFEVLRDIQSRPNYPLYQRSKLYIAEPGTTLAQMEEAYMSRWAEKIPLVGASQRAYTTFLNRLRADSFDTMVDTLGRDGNVTAQEASAIANYINAATGRGNLGNKAQALVGLNTAFFAPRYVASRFQLLAGQPMYGGTARTRTAIAKEYARYLTGIATVYALGKLASAEIETDPRSSDFGKLRFGETRVDPMSGLAQATTLVSRLAAGETKRLSGKVVPIRGEKVPYGGDDSADVIARFLRTKLAPIPGAVIDVLSGKNVVGEKVTPQSVVTNAAVPLAFRDIYEAMMEQGVPRGTALAILSIFGFGLQTYEPRQAAGGQR